MEVQRSTRHRSLGMDSNPQPANYAKVKRPSLGDRHKSAPLVPQSDHHHHHHHHHQSQARLSSIASRPSIASPTSVQDSPVVGPRGDRQIINLIVLGHPRVGKTTFIRNALNLDRTISTTVLSSKVRLENTDYRIRLCEAKFSDLKILKGHVVTWPKPIGDDLLPSIDGALCLYDLTNESSIDNVPQTLYALSKTKIPFMLVACKADAPISGQEVGITFVERMRRSFPLATFGETSSTSAESAKKCLDIALKTSLAISQLQAAAAEDSDENDTSQLMKARSTDFVPTFTVTAHSQAPMSEASLPQNAVLSRTDGLEAGIMNFPAMLNSPRSYEIETQKIIKERVEQKMVFQSGSNHPVESPDELEAPMDKPIAKESARSDSEEGGVSFTDLVSRLLQMPATKNESKFVPAFLCLYRAFATPKRLLVEILDRFMIMEQSSLVPLTKVAELLRYLQVLAQWTANYPGDFAESSTRRRAISFAQDLEHNRNFAPAAKEIIGNLLTIIMDDDKDWAYEDTEDDEKLLSRRTTRSSFMGRKRDSSHHTESDTSDDDNKPLRRRSVRNSGSESTASSILRSSVTSSQSATNLFNLDNAREQSKLLKSVPHVPLTKLQWHCFMGVSTEELAREITRMDWIMYSAIRARDFVRHVSLSSQQRARLKHADTIGMMVKHFNHLALFVSSMILLRDKPKHRAKILEKFMDLAWKVRQLNNYNSLGAVVAGITGPEITRLKHTHELIPADVQKQFLRLTVLMSTSRSYAAYRMAWDNSSSERIPFIPLVRQDLTMAAGANQTLIGKNINWKKFEIMGDVIVGIQRSHEQPYLFPERTPRSQETTKLLLETKVIEESEDSADPRGELYERSVQLEPSSVGGDSRKSMANFGVKRTMTGWFQS